MANARQTALAKLSSLKISLFNAVTELEMRAAAETDDEKSSELLLQASALARQFILVRVAEDEVRAQMPLTPIVTELDAIAAEARATLDDLKKTAEGLDKAARLLEIIGRLAQVFT